MKLPLTVIASVAAPWALLLWNHMPSLANGIGLLFPSTPQLSESSSNSDFERYSIIENQELRQKHEINSPISVWPEKPNFVYPSTNKKNTDFNKGKMTYNWPTKGYFSSGYGWRWGRMHRGIDIANSIGTTIHASRDGIISFAGWDGNYGYLIEIRHVDGQISRYAHNNRLYVRVGDIVSQGGIIASMGSSGRSSGPHLHFEIVLSNGNTTNPLPYLTSS